MPCVCISHCTCTCVPTYIPCTGPAWLCAGAIAGIQFTVGGREAGPAAVAQMVVRALEEAQVRPRLGHTVACAAYDQVA